MTTDTSIFDRRTEYSEEIYANARAKGWSDDLLDKARALRVPQGQMEFWLKHEGADSMRQYLAGRELLMSGTMRARQASWNDEDALADLYANSPEDIGEWEITVERSPYPYAQFRLQEHCAVSVLEDRHVILAATADSSRNTIVGGKRSTVHIASAWRVRKEFRGKGLSRLLRHAEGPPTAWFGMYNYYFIRSGNFAALGWIKSFIPESVNAPQREGDVPGLPVSVHHITPVPFSGNSTGIRQARRSDLSRCVRLINRTHRGCDLFRPYSREFLEERLDDPCWGDKPEFWVPVFGWPDYYVLQENGRIIACAGLWDKGRNVREIWRHKQTIETKTFDCAALMDFGHEEGREDAMVRLIAYLSGLTAALRRTYLTAAVEHLPSLVEALQPLGPLTETRALHFQLYNPEVDQWQMDSSLNRVYTDLAYW
jgi:hypothetical protein